MVHDLEKSCGRKRAVVTKILLQDHSYLTIGSTCSCAAIAKLTTLPVLGLLSPCPVIRRLSIDLDAKVFFDGLANVDGTIDLLFAIAQVVAPVHVAFGLRPD